MKRYGSGSQVSQAVALWLGVPPTEAVWTTVLTSLANDVVANGAFSLLLCNDLVYFLIGREICFAWFTVFTASHRDCLLSTMSVVVLRLRSMCLTACDWSHY